MNHDEPHGSLLHGQEKHGLFFGGLCPEGTAHLLPAAPTTAATVTIVRGSGPALGREAGPRSLTMTVEGGWQGR